jgi:hypothetical protein
MAVKYPVAGVNFKLPPVVLVALVGSLTAYVV